MKGRFTCTAAPCGGHQSASRPHMWLVRLALWAVVSGSLASVSLASADEPHPSATVDEVASPTPEGSPVRPSEPPRQAINCMFPDVPEKLRPSLGSTEPFSVAVGSSSVTLNIPRPGPGATCYAVYRAPAGPNPISFAWSATAIDPPRHVADEVPFPFSGSYCYRLYFGDASGVSTAAEACVDIPQSIAPPPKPAATLPFRAPPGVGGPPATGTTIAIEPQDGPEWWLFAMGGALAAIGAAGVFVEHRLRR